MTKSPNLIDVHVGGRVRLRRMMLGMSQEKLGEQLGLTFQQIQKYEKGANRIGASRLFHIASILDVPVQYFFDDMPEEAKPEIDPGVDTESAESQVDLAGFLRSPEGLQLNLAFAQIEDPATRRRLMDLVRALADNVSNGDD